MYILRVRDHFDAAHFLPWHEGKCKNLHGHRWEVEVTIRAKSLNKNGIIVDFGSIKALLPDHFDLNEIMNNPTCELIADKLYHDIMRLLGECSVDYSSISVQVWESPNCSVERINQ